MNRIFDLLVALGLMLILAPLFLLLVLAVMLPSVGPVLFRTQRVGKVNKLVALYKFRTMRMDTAQVATYLLREPDQFLTYIQAGLPILARINPGTDLANIINGEGVGRTYTGTQSRNCVPLRNNWLTIRRASVDGPVWTCLKRSNIFSNAGSESDHWCSLRRGKIRTNLLPLG